MRGDTSEPINGIPSLSDAEIIQIYQEAFGRPPTPQELDSERQNALKYSAAGIERSIMLRASNVAGSGVRGDETAAPLTVPHPILGNVATMGVAAIAPAVTPTGPTGTLAAPTTYGYPGGSAGYPGNLAGYPSAMSSGGFLGFDTTTLIIVAAIAAGAWYFLKK